MNPTLKQGTNYLTGDLLIIGNAPLDEVGEAGYHAKWLVNRGLRDVVEWLGEVPLPRSPANMTLWAMRTAQRQRPNDEFTDGRVL